MDIELVKQIVDYIRELAEPMVTAGYELVLRQVQFKMIYNIIICAAMIVIFYVGIRFIGHGRSEQKKSEYSMYEMWMAFGGLIVFMSALVFFILLYSILNTLINPDWVAIQTLFSLVSNNQ